MKRTLTLIFLFCALPAALTAQIGMYQHGSVVRMHMADCLLTHRPFMMAFGNPAAPPTPEPAEYCPEYTLVSSNVVFVIVGKSSNHVIPLAEIIDFRLLKNEVAVRVDDAKKESKFIIKEMIVRSEWDRIQRHIEDEMRATEEQAAMKTRN
ncbi:MAG: hypothetical protein WAM04_10450 [Candidatus Sulfotelmatobacter sp.]